MEGTTSALCNHGQKAAKLLSLSGRNGCRLIVYVNGVVNDFSVGIVAR